MDVQVISFNIIDNRECWTIPNVMVIYDSSVYDIGGKATIFSDSIDNVIVSRSTSQYIIRSTRNGR